MKRKELISSKLKSVRAKVQDRDNIHEIWKKTRRTSKEECARIYYENDRDKDKTTDVIDKIEAELLTGDAGVGTYGPVPMRALPPACRGGCKFSEFKFNAKNNDLQLDEGDYELAEFMGMEPEELRKWKIAQYYN